jgi:hypothetical protein
MKASCALVRALVDALSLPSRGARLAECPEKEKPMREQPPTPPGNPDGATVPVAVVTSRAEAELIVGMLRNNDVRAAVSADDAGGQQPELQVQGVRVLVAPSDEAQARQLLAAADDAPSEVPQDSAFRRWMSAHFGSRRG